MDSMPNIDGIKRIKFCDYIEITDISDEEADSMIETINKFYKVMSERKVDIE